MMVHHQQLLLLLLSSSSRPSLQLIKPLLLAPPPSLLKATKWYTQRKDDDGNHEIGEKARSVAEEFARVAKEKGGFVSQSVEDPWEGTMEAGSKALEKGEPDVESVKNTYEESAARRKLTKEGQD